MANYTRANLEKLSYSELYAIYFIEKARRLFWFSASVLTLIAIIITASNVL
jgi:hypothetical protein